MFRRADVEGKGFLVKKDLQRFQSEVSLTADQLSAVFESLDTCASGFLTLDQFLAGVSNFGNGSILGNNEDYIANNYQTDNDQIVRNIINLSMLSRSGSLLQKLNTLIQDSVTEEIDKPWRNFIQELGIDMQRLKEQTEELERVLAARDRRHEEEIQKLFDELETQLSEEKEKMSLEIDTRDKSLRLEMREKLDAKDRLISDVLAQRDEALGSLYNLQVHDNNVKLENINLQKLKVEYQKEIKQQQEIILRLQGELENTKAEQEMKCKSCFHQGFLLAQKLAVAEENGLLQQLAMIKEMQSILKNNYSRKKVEFVDVSGT